MKLLSTTVAIINEWIKLDRLLWYYLVQKYITKQAFKTISPVIFIQFKKLKKSIKLHQICNPMQPTLFFYLKSFRNGKQLKLLTLILKWWQNHDLFLSLFVHGYPIEINIYWFLLSATYRILCISIELRFDQYFGS